MRAKKTDRPNNFKGVVAVLWASENPDEYIGYEKGEVIDFVMDDQDPGSLMWGDARFEIIFIRGLSRNNMTVMLEDLRDPIEPRLVVERRKRKFDLDNIEIKNKVVWEGTAIENTVITKEYVIEQPDIIEIP